MAGTQIQAIYAVVALGAIALIALFFKFNGDRAAKRALNDARILALSNPLDDFERRTEPASQRFGRWVAWAIVAGIVILALSDLGRVGQAAAGPAGSLLIGLPLLAIYLLPAIIAERRHHRNRTAIGVLNLLLGWTFIGWVIALVWSLTADIE